MKTKAEIVKVLEKYFWCAHCNEDGSLLNGEDSDCNWRLSIYVAEHIADEILE